MSDAIEPFRLDIPQGALDDLRRRLTETRWPGYGDGLGLDMQMQVGASAEVELMPEGTLPRTAGKTTIIERT